MSSLSQLPRKARKGASFASSWIAGRGYAIENLEVLVTPLCNARCRMCNIWRVPGKRPDTADRALSLERLQRLAVEASELGTSTVSLCGGEPLLRRDIGAIIRAFKAQDIIVSIVTNGTQLTRPGLAEEVVAAAPDFLIVSLDSSSPAYHDEIRGRPGFWERTTSGLKALAAERTRQGTDKPHVKMMSLVSHRNIPEVFGVRDLIGELGADDVIFNPLIDKVPANLSEDLLTPEDVVHVHAEGVNMGPLGDVSFYRSHLCFAPFRQVSIDPFGEVYPCCFAEGFLNLGEDLESTFWGEPDRYSMGSIADKSLAEVWGGDAFRRFRLSLHETPAYKMCGLCNQPPVEPWTSLQPVFKCFAAVESGLGVRKSTSHREPAPQVAAIDDERARRAPAKTAGGVASSRHS